MSQRHPIPSFNFSGYKALVDRSKGIYPYYSVHVRGRMKDKLSANTLITGEGGVSKTYTGAFTAKIQNRRWDVRTDLVMNFAEYMGELRRDGKTYVPLEFDEPQDAIYNRDWQKDTNKALVKTMTSQRFRLRPIIVPIINQSLLDINIRKYLLNYHIILFRRGEGIAYTLTASQREDRTYYNRLCRIKYGMMDINLCSRDSCLRCNQLHKKDGTGDYTCNIWRAIYERKKYDEINKRDDKSIEDARQKVAKSFTDKEVILGISPMIRKMLVEKNGKLRIDVTEVSIQSEEILGVSLGINRAGKIRRLLEKQYPEYAR